MDVCSKWGVDPKALKEFRRWLKEQHHLPQATPDDYLAQFIHCCYFDLEAAKKAINVYFRTKSSAPEFFAKRSFDEPNLANIIKVGQIVILPDTSVQGYSVIFGRLTDYRPSVYSFEDTIKYLYMLVDIIHLERPGCPGIIFIYDIKGFSFRHIFRLSINSLKVYFEYTQDANPMRSKGIHILNASAAMKHLLYISKPFMYKEHVNQINLYTAGQFDEVTSVLAKENMPQEFGGKGLPMAKLLEETVKKARYYADWFANDEILCNTKNQ